MVVTLSSVITPIATSATAQIVGKDVMEPVSTANISESHCGQQPLGDARHCANATEKNRCGEKRQNDTGELRRHGVGIAQDSRDRVGLDGVEGKAKREDQQQRESHAPAPGAQATLDVEGGPAAEGAVRQSHLKNLGLDR